LLKQSTGHLVERDWVLQLLLPPARYPAKFKGVSGNLHLHHLIFSHDSLFGFPLRAYNLLFLGVSISVRSRSEVKDHCCRGFAPFLRYLFILILTNIFLVCGRLRPCAPQGLTNLCATFVEPRRHEPCSLDERINKRIACLLACRVLYQLGITC